MNDMFTICLVVSESGHNAHVHALFKEQESNALPACVIGGTNNGCYRDNTTTLRLRVVVGIIGFVLFT